MTDTADPAATRARDMTWLARHRIAYAIVIGALLAANIATFSGYLWAFWPAFGWGIVLLVHYLFVRSIHVDEAWVDERAADLRMKSYDFDHMHTIKGRFARGDLDRAPSQRSVEEKR